MGNSMRDCKPTGENRYLTPTFQSLLLLGLNTVAERLAEADLIGGWQALRALYVELPPDCQKECQADFAAVQKSLSNIQRISGLSLAETVILKQNATLNLLDVANLELFNKFKASLFAKGYLEISPTKPRNPQPLTLGE
jgi:hypothetical protein